MTGHAAGHPTTTSTRVAHRGRRSSRLPAIFWRLSAAMAIARLGLFVLPFLAYYLDRARHLDAGNVAVVMVAFGLGWTAGTPAGGYLADLVGRRRVITIGNLAAAAGYAALGLAHTLPQMTVSACAVG